MYLVITSSDGTLGILGSYTDFNLANEAASAWLVAEAPTVSSSYYIVALKTVETKVAP